MPLLVGVVAALRVKVVGCALAINGWALALSAAYLAWSALGQAWVTQHAKFTDGFFKVQRSNDNLLVTDLRMGQEPDYVFAFDIGLPSQAGQIHPAAVQKSRQMDVGAGLLWLGQRILGRDLPPPGHGG